MIEKKVKKKTCLISNETQKYNENKRKGKRHVYDWQVTKTGKSTKPKHPVRPHHSLAKSCSKHDVTPPLIKGACMHPLWRHSVTHTHARTLQDWIPGSLVDWPACTEHGTPTNRSLNQAVPTSARQQTKAWHNSDVTAHNATAATSISPFYVVVI